MGVIRAELETFRARSWFELSTLIDGEPAVGEGFGPSGKKYYFEILVYWDHRPGGDIRVIGNIDDGGWRAILPLGDSFIKAPDGSFVDE